MTYLYQLFPNVMLATFPDFMVMVVLDPVDVDHTTVTTYSMASADVADRASVDLTGQPAAGSLVARGAVEDNEMSAGVQRGLHVRCKRILGVWAARERDRALPRQPSMSAWLRLATDAP